MTHFVFTFKAAVIWRRKKSRADLRRFSFGPLVCFIHWEKGQKSKNTIKCVFLCLLICPISCVRVMWREKSKDEEVVMEAWKRVTEDTEGNKTDHIMSWSVFRINIFKFNCKPSNINQKFVFSATQEVEVLLIRLNFPLCFKSVSS